MREVEDGKEAKGAESSIMGAHVLYSYMNEDRCNFSLLHITALSNKSAHVN